MGYGKVISGIREMKDCYITKSLIPYYEECLVPAINKYEPDEIIWLGMSAVGAWAYSRFSRESGGCVKKLRIADNNIRKQGMLIPSYLLDGLFVDSRIQSVESCADNSNAIFCTVNPHYASYKKQLEQLGVDSGRIVDLYQNEKVLSDHFSNELDKIKREGYNRIEGRDIQLRLLDILKHFHEFCEDHDLTYFLGFGTLLGAVRHHGFIPWDDDVDVLMPYEDYVRLMEIFPADGRFVMADYRFQDSYQWQFAKLMDSETRTLHNGFADMYFMGLNIDIFPLCGYPEDEAAAFRHIKRNMKLDYEWQLGHMMYRSGFIKEKEFINRINSEKFAIPFSEAAGFRGLLVMSGKEYITPASCFRGRVKLDFEGSEFYVPQGYEFYLSQTYNNYMTLPPEEKRKIHGYASYAKAE